MNEYVKGAIVAVLAVVAIGTAVYAGVTSAAPVVFFMGAGYGSMVATTLATVFRGAR